MCAGSSVFSPKVCRDSVTRFPADPSYRPAAAANAFGFSVIASMVYVSILRQPRRCVLSIVFDCRRRNLGRPIKEPVCRCYCHTDSRRGDGCFGGPERNRTAVRQQSLRLHTAIFLGGIPFTRLTRITFGTEFTDYRRGPWCLNDQNLIRGVTTAQPSITLTVSFASTSFPVRRKK